MASTAAPLPVVDPATPPSGGSPLKISESESKGPGTRPKRRSSATMKPPEPRPKRRGRSRTNARRAVPGDVSPSATSIVRTRASSSPETSPPTSPAYDPDAESLASVPDAAPVTPPSPPAERERVLADFCTGYRMERKPKSKEAQEEGVAVLTLDDSTICSATSAAAGATDAVIDSADDTPATGPSVEIDDSGNIIIKESSLLLDGNGKPVTRRRVRGDLGEAELDAADAADGFTEVIEENSGQLTATYTSFRETGPNCRQYSNTKDRWDAEMTKRFYWALRRCGTDFSRIERMFEGTRTRKQLKAKYLREERINPALLDLVLDPSRQLPTDVSIFGITEKDVEQVSIDKAAIAEKIKEEKEELQKVREEKKKIDKLKPAGNPDTAESVCSVEESFVQEGAGSLSGEPNVVSDPSRTDAVGSIPFSLGEDNAGRVDEEEEDVSTADPEQFFLDDQPAALPAVRFGGGSASKKKGNKFQPRIKPRGGGAGRGGIRKRK